MRRLVAAKGDVHVTGRCFMTKHTSRPGVGLVQVACASQQRSLETVRFLLDAKCSANDEGGYSRQSPLLLAVLACDLELTRLLLGTSARQCAASDTALHMQTTKPTPHRHTPSCKRA